MDSADYYRLSDLIKHIDMCTYDVLGSAHLVFLYTLDQESDKWIDLGIQGELVVCSRNEKPYLVIHILNHVTKQKLMEPVLEEMGWEMVPPMFSYKKDKAVFGIRFNNQEEYVIITSLVKDAMNAANLKPNVQPVKQEFTAIQIFSMISEAQQSIQEVVGMLDVKIKADERSKTQEAPTSKISVEDPLEGTSHHYPNVPTMDMEELEMLTSAMSLLNKDSGQPEQKPSPVSTEKPKSDYDVAKDSKEPKNDEVDNLDIPEPLTKRQMIQFLLWLLKNDSEFAKKVYDAYIKCFMKWL